MQKGGDRYCIFVTCEHVSSGIYGMIELHRSIILNNTIQLVQTSCEYTEANIHFQTTPFNVSIQRDDLSAIFKKIKLKVPVCKENMKV